MNMTHLRSQIPATRNVVYLNTGWSGPSPTAVVERIRDWLEFENTEGPTVPHVLEERRHLQRDAREAVARLAPQIWLTSLRLFDDVQERLFKKRDVFLRRLPG